MFFNLRVPSHFLAYFTVPPPSIIPQIVNLCLLSFLCQSSQKFVNSINLFKEQPLRVIDFFYCFLFPVLFISALICTSCSLQPALADFAATFSTLLRWEHRLLIWGLFSSLMYACNTMYFSNYCFNCVSQI